MTRRRMRASAVLAAAALALTGCVGIPTSGPVESGPEFRDSVPGDFVFNPFGPEPGADPQRILEGFIDAYTGTQGDYAVARQFLTTQFQAEWEPRRSVLVRTTAESLRAVDETTFEYSFTTMGQLDETGAYTTTVPAPQSLTYRLEQEDGEWRIAEAPAGIVLASSAFLSIFSPHSLYFFDLSLTSLVPDTRWFSGGTTATRIVSALLAGVPDWLQGAAVSQFPEGTNLSAGTAVTVEDATARVDLTAEAASASERQRQLMRLQLTESLRTVSGIGNVEVSIGGTPLMVDPLGPDGPTVDPRVDPRPLAIVDGEFGYVAGGEVSDMGNLGDAIVALDPIAVTYSSALQAAAVQDAQGAVWFVGSDGASTLVDGRPGLAAPSLDGHGFVWSEPVDDVRDLTVFDASGTAFPVETGLPAGTTVRSVDVSRDGARVALLLDTAAGARLIVAGVVRDATQGYVPVALGTPRIDVLLAGDTPIDATWVDDSSVATLVVDDDFFDVAIHEIGGNTTSLGRPEPSVAIVGGNGQAGLRVLGADGSLSVPRGSAWQRSSISVELIATQR